MPGSLEMQAADALEAAQAEIDMHMRVATNAIDRVVTLKAEIERQDLEYAARGLLLIDTERERDQALARLAKLEKQEPIGVVERTWAPWPNEGEVNIAVEWTNEANPPPVGTKLYAAAGASPVQPSQAQAALDAILWYYENCTGSEPSISAFQQMVDRVVKMKPNFCESCAMDIATCDCVTPRPATVTVQPSQADAQDAARYRWLREYLPSDDLQYDDNLVLAKTGEDIDAAIDAAINAKGNAS